MVLQYADPGTPESVAGGRVAKAHFPIESWPKSHECPFPTVNDGNYKVSIVWERGVRSEMIEAAVTRGIGQAVI